MNDLIAQKPVPPQGALATTDSQRAIAEVQAALFVAQQRPRNIVAVLDRVANAFTRIGLAEVSEYEYARGGTNISGPTIRAAEAIAQLYQNVQYGFRELSRTVDDEGVAESEVEAFCWDVENNVRQGRQFRVRHWRDRKPPAKGYALTDERDIYELLANMAQRRTRACILSVLPGDIIETAMNQAAVTMKAEADTSPESQKKIVAAFAEFDVTQDQIEARIQRHIDAIQPAQVIQLKRIYASLRDGMSTPDSWFAQGADDGAEPKRKSEAPPAAPVGSPAVRDAKVAHDAQAAAADRMFDASQDIAHAAGWDDPDVTVKARERQPGEDDEPEPPSPRVSAGQASWIKRKAKELKIDLAPILHSAGVTDPAQLNQSQFESLKKSLVK